MTLIRLPRPGNQSVCDVSQQDFVQRAPAVDLHTACPGLTFLRWASVGGPQPGFQAMDHCRGLLDGRPRLRFHTEGPGQTIIRWAPTGLSYDGFWSVGLSYGLSGPDPSIWYLPAQPGLYGGPRAVVDPGGMSLWNSSEGPYFVRGPISLRKCLFASQTFLLLQKRPF